MYRRTGERLMAAFRPMRTFPPRRRRWRLSQWSADMTSMTEQRARMLLRGSMITALVLSPISLGWGLHWLTLKRELTVPLAALYALTSLCIYLSARWLRRRQLPL